MIVYKKLLQRANHNDTEQRILTSLAESSIIFVLDRWMDG